MRSSRKGVHPLAEWQECITTHILPHQIVKRRRRYDIVSYKLALCQLYTLCQLCALAWVHVFTCFPGFSATTSPELMVEALQTYPPSRDI
jgi:hypothetical protein